MSVSNSAASPGSPVSSLTISSSSQTAGAFCRQDGQLGTSIVPDQGSRRLSGRAVALSVETLTMVYVLDDLSA